MHVKRYIAPSMQEALKTIREELGAEAMILSTRKVSDGVEVVCALDYDPDQARQQTPVQEGMTEAEVARRVATRRALLDEELSRARQKIIKAAEKTQAATPEPEVTEEPDLNKSSASSLSQEATAGPVTEALAAMQSQIEALKAQLAESGRASRPYQDDPLTERLTGLGLTPAMSAELAAQVSRDAEDRWNHVLARLARAIATVDVEKDPSPRAIALVGPTGAGKTTTLAKLAARYIRSHGREGLTLITTDRFRVAASGQLQALGKLLGVPVHVITGKQSLSQVMDELIQPRLVLIDTAGLTPADPNGATQLRELDDCPHRIEKYLVTSAVSQAQVMKSNYHYYRMLGLSGCMITKVDEACTLGQALELSLREHLPVACYTDGQNIARDFHPATGHGLVARAVALELHAQSQNPMPAGLVG